RIDEGEDRVPLPLLGRPDLDLLDHQAAVLVTHQLVDHAAHGLALHDLVGPLEQGDGDGARRVGHGVVSSGSRAASTAAITADARRAARPSTTLSSPAPAARASAAAATTSGSGPEGMVTATGQPS